VTDRLRLVPVEPRDSVAVFSLLRNDKIKKYLCDNKDVEKEFVNRIISGSETLFEEKGIGLWLIRELATDSTMGFCGFFKNEQLELIYVVHPDFQNNGYATEACLQVIEYFSQLKLKDDVFAKIDLPNVGSHVVANKIGMREVGIRRNPETGGDMKLYKLQSCGDLNLR
jgi:RimJ/RimL family protein N-acetyltransferase